MEKTIIETNQAPSAIGTYSQAVKCDNTVYISGQLPMDPISMKIIEGTISEQIEQVFNNLEAIAQAAGGELRDIAKLNVYLTDMAHSLEVNQVMKTRFCEPYPARAAVAVKSLPKQAPVEIEAIMVCDNG